MRKCSSSRFFLVGTVMVLAAMQSFGGHEDTESPIQLPEEDRPRLDYVLSFLQWSKMTGDYQQSHEGDLYEIKLDLDANGFDDALLLANSLQYVHDLWSCYLYRDGAWKECYGEKTAGPKTEREEYLGHYSLSPENAPYWRLLHKVVSNERVGILGFQDSDVSKTDMFVTYLADDVLRRDNLGAVGRDQGGSAEEALESRTDEWRVVEVIVPHVVAIEDVLRSLSYLTALSIDQLVGIVESADDPVLRQMAWCELTWPDRRRWESFSRLLAMAEKGTMTEDVVRRLCMPLPNDESEDKKVKVDRLLSLLDSQIQDRLSEEDEESLSTYLAAVSRMASPVYVGDRKWLASYGKARCYDILMKALSVDSLRSRRQVVGCLGQLGEDYPEFGERIRSALEELLQEFETSKDLPPGSFESEQVVHGSLHSEEPYYISFESKEVLNALTETERFYYLTLGRTVQALELRQHTGK